MSLLDEFWERVAVSAAGCWEWQGSRLPRGYGRIGTGRGQVYAHRLSWEIANRTPVPARLQVLHSCDNPKCVRPDHLFLGTQMENIADARAKGRLAVGSRAGHAKLNEAIVAEVLRAYAAGEVGQIRLARRFGISKGAMQCIVERRTWRHVS